MIRKYYIDEVPEGGGGGNPPAPPKGYVLSTPQQRTDWNSFLDYAGKQPGANLTDPKAQVALLSQYKKANPNFSITADQIPSIQYEGQQIRKGDQFGNMNSSALDYMRQGMSPAFLARDGSDISKLYYPQTESHGTDIEGYYGSKMGLDPVSGEKPSPAAAIEKVSTIAPNLNLPAAPAGKVAEPIPLPNFTDAKSRGQFTVNFKKKYNNIFQDVPEKIQYAIGDIPLNVNETPRGAKDTSKNITEKFGKQYDIDPALLYTSFMAEGGSGLYKSRATGLDTRNRKPGDYGYQGFYGDKEFPINGPESFGFVTFADRFPELVQGDYLPKSFANQFRGKKGAGEFGENDFKSVESAMQAKAAMLKFSQDKVQEYAKSKGIQLSDKAKEFFTLAAFNGGEGGYLKRMLQYKKEGLLDGDKFLTRRPASEEAVKGTIADVWGHVAPRMKIRDALKNEKQFE